MKSPLAKLTDWYSKQCDERWEHSYGFSITTLDNPGVAVDIDLLGTPLQAVPFKEKSENLGSDSNWIICQRTESKFEGRGSPEKLEAIISEFLAWAEKNENHGG